MNPGTFMGDTTVQIPVTAYGYEDSDGCVELFFAVDEAGARRYASSQYGIDEDDAGIKRYAAFDKYGTRDGQVVTDTERFLEDWPVACMHCDRTIDVDEDDDEDAEAAAMEPVTEGDFVYCSPACREARAARWARIRANERLATDEVAQRYPFATVTNVGHGGHGGKCHDCFQKDSDNVYVEFSFPLSPTAADAPATSTAWFCLGCRLSRLFLKDMAAWQRLMSVHEVRPDAVVSGGVVHGSAPV